MSPEKPGRALSLAWRRASFCGNHECLEVAQQDDMIVLRDSTRPHGAMLHYAARDWESFVQSIKSGKLDGLGS